VRHGGIVEAVVLQAAGQVLFVGGQVEVAAAGQAEQDGPRAALGIFYASFIRASERTRSRWGCPGRMRSCVCA
jgi:hypothetical protein